MSSLVVDFRYACKTLKGSSGRISQRMPLDAFLHELCREPQAMTNLWADSGQVGGAFVCRQVSSVCTSGPTQGQGACNRASVTSFLPRNVASTLLSRLEKWFIAALHVIAIHSNWRMISTPVPHTPAAQSHLDVWRKVSDVCPRYTKTEALEEANPGPGTGTGSQAHAPTRCGDAAG